MVAPFLLRIHMLQWVDAYFIAQDKEIYKILNDHSIIESNVLQNCVKVKENGYLQILRRFL